MSSPEYEKDIGHEPDIVVPNSPHSDGIGPNVEEELGIGIPGSGEEARIDPFAVNDPDVDTEIVPERIDPFSEDYPGKDEAPPDIDEVIALICEQFGPGSIGIGTDPAENTTTPKPLVKDKTSPSDEIIDPFEDDFLDHHSGNLDELPPWAVDDSTQFNTGADISFEGCTVIPVPVAKAEPINTVVVEREAQTNTTPRYVHPDAVAGTLIHDSIAKAQTELQTNPEILPERPGGGDRSKFADHFESVLNNPALADTIDGNIAIVGRDAAQQLEDLSGEQQWQSEVPFIPSREQRDTAGRLIPELVPDAWSITHDPHNYRLMNAEGDDKVDGIMERCGIVPDRKNGFQQLTADQIRIISRSATPEEIASSVFLRRAVAPLAELSRYGRVWGINESDFKNLQSQGMPDAYRDLIAGLGVKPDAIGLSANSPDGQDAIDALGRITRGSHFGKRPMYDLANLSDEDTRALADLLDSILNGEPIIDIALAEHKTRLSVGSPDHPKWDRITRDGVNTNRVMEQIARDMAYTGGGVVTWAANMARELAPGYTSLAHAPELDAALGNHDDLGHQALTNDKLRRRIENGLVGHMRAFYTDIRGPVLDPRQRKDDPGTYFGGYFGVRPDFGTKPEDLITARVIPVDTDVLWILSQDRKLNPEVRRRVLRRLRGY